jgi:hypothetical protein
VPQRPKRERCNWNLSPTQASASGNRQEPLSLAFRTTDRRPERGFRRFTYTESIRVASRDAKFEPTRRNHGIAEAQVLTHPVPTLRSRRVREPMSGRGVNPHRADHGGIRSRAPRRSRGSQT